MRPRIETLRGKCRHVALAAGTLILAEPALAGANGTVPEPSTLALIAGGVAAAIFVGRRRK